MPRNRGLGRVRRSRELSRTPLIQELSRPSTWSRVIPNRKEAWGAILSRSGLRLALTLLDGGVSLLGRRDFLAQLGDRRVHRDDFSLAHPDPAFGRSSTRGPARQGGALGPKKHENGRKKQEGRESFHHISSASAFLSLHVPNEQTRPSEMSNAAIIVLADAEAVPVRTLADRLRMHPVDVVKDLRGRGYRLGSIRGAAGHWTMALKRNDAERYLAERREAGAP